MTMDVTTSAEADAEAWLLVIELAACDPIAYDQVTRTSMRCTLCDAEPPGASTTLADSQHDKGCPWRRAVELEAACAARGIGPAT